MGNQERKIENFKVSTEIVLYIAELVKERCSKEQREIIDQVIVLLKTAYPEPIPPSIYMRTYTGSKNKDDAYKLNEKLKRLTPFEY